MIDGLFEFVVSALAALAAVPLGFFFPCSPCCGGGGGCGVADGKPRTDPANEGTWVPSGTWRGVGGVTWTFTANPGDDSGETWFFYGNAFTSKVGGKASVAEQQDWGNICNWYSNKTTSPSVATTDVRFDLNKRATRLPPVDAVVHIYTFVSTVTAGPQTVKYAYFWDAAAFLAGSEITLTATAHDSNGGAVFIGDSYNAGTVNGGATFNGDTDNRGTVNDGATFNKSSGNNPFSTVNGGATFNDIAENIGTVNDGATFNDDTNNYVMVNGGATFNATSDNRGTVNDGATFNDDTNNYATVNGGAKFNDRAQNLGTVNP